MQGNHKVTQIQDQNNKAIGNAHKRDVRSASWLKIVVFALPVIAVIAGVIWASTLE